MCGMRCGWPDQIFLQASEAGKPLMLLLRKPARVLAEVLILWTAHRAEQTVIMYDVAVKVISTVRVEIKLLSNI